MYIEDNNIVELSQLGDVPNKILDLIDQLHSLDIFHGDLHTSNIVFNPETDDVRLIDFGESRRISQMSKKDISYFNEFFDLDTPLTTINQFVEFERTNWILDYFRV